MSPNINTSKLYLPPPNNQSPPLDTTNSDDQDNYSTSTQQAPSTNSNWSVFHIGRRLRQQEQSSSSRGSNRTTTTIKKTSTRLKTTCSLTYYFIACLAILICWNFYFARRVSSSQGVSEIMNDFTSPPYDKRPSLQSMNKNNSSKTTTITTTTTTKEPTVAVATTMNNISSFGDWEQYRNKTFTDILKIKNFTICRQRYGIVDWGNSKRPMQYYNFITGKLKTPILQKGAKKNAGAKKIGVAKKNFKFENKKMTNLNNVTRQRRRRRRLSTTSSTPRLSPRDLCFVHVGKTGGSSVDCHLRIGQVNDHCRWTRRRFRTMMQRNPQKESALSRLTTCRKHIYNIMYDKNRTSEDAFSYVVSVRHPIHRIQSWYVYEHLRNIRQTLHRVDWLACGTVMLHTCYKSLDHLASVGLEGSRPPPPGVNMTMPFGTSISSRDCRQWAWGVIQGTQSAFFHNMFNYGYYTKYFLRDPNTEIFVIRNEYLWSDWAHLDQLFNGTGQLHPWAKDTVNPTTKYNLTVTDRYVSQRGLLNLCIALCEEIQIYKSLIRRAVNLGEEDKEVSMRELRKVCPLEVTIEERDCHYD